MANQYTHDPMRSKKEQAYVFVRDNPGCTAVQVALATGVQTKTASVNLTRLSQDGRISGYRVSGELRIRWNICDDRPENDAPLRIVRQQWEPHHHREALHVALFGPARGIAA